MGVLRACLYDLELVQNFCAGRASSCKACLQLLFLLSSMDESTREVILSLLPHMARPPNVGEDEWQSLLLLEAPSMLGMAMPGAGAAEGSEPTFVQESIESELEVLSAEDSLAGYSPSPAAAPIMRHGFNLSVPGDLVLEGLECSHPSEQMALHALRDGYGRMTSCRSRLTCRTALETFRDPWQVMRGHVLS